MSRLDSFIRRMTAQRDCLNAAARMIARIPGPVLEFGLGNGRTYDHLREILPDREIWVFERRIAAHPDCIPGTDRLLLGDLRDTMVTAAARIGTPAALAHVDIGTGDPGQNADLAAFLCPRLDRLMARNGIVASDQPLAAPNWTALPLPDGVQAGRYHLFRVGSAAESSHST
jgi:hypothetical protein